MRLGWIYISLIILGFTSCKVKKNSIQSQNDANHQQQFDNKIEELLIQATTEKVLHNYDKAETLYKSILQAEPKLAVAHFEISEIYEAKKDASNTISHAKAAVDLDPDNEWYRANLARVYMITNQFGNSESQYKLLLKDHPNNTNYLFNLAEVYLYQGKLKESLPLYNKIEERMGISEELILHKNKIHIQLNQPDSAIAEMYKLIETFPGESRYYGILAEIYEEIGENQKALDTYNKLLEVDPSNGYVHLSLSEYYKYHGQKDKSREELVLAFKNGSVDPITKSEVLNEYFVNSERNDELKTFSYELLNIMKELHPEESVTYTIYADFLIRDGKTDEAIEMTKKALELSPSNYSLHYQLMISLTSNSRFKELDLASETAIELFPNQPAFYYFNGISNIQLKNYEKAIEMLELGKDLVFENNQLKGDFYQYLGDANNGAKQFEQSDFYYDKALALNPNNVYVLNNYAYYLSLRKTKLDYAAEMAKKANDLYPNNATYMDTYGWVLYQMNNLIDAELWIQKALDNGGDNSGEVLEHYGDVLFKMNKKTEAIEYWNKAKEAGGTSENIDKKIETQSLIED
ncbi:MAG: hypothetical protein H6598_06345 [Flavobacteriales bacterium]|nr:hypothetical protein [Flavobacteriales bacterium]